MTRTKPFAALAVALLAAFLTAAPATGQATNPEGVQGFRALTGVRSVAAGYYHSCAVLQSGQARCWGDNGTGQLGNGGPDEVSPPAPVVNAAGSGPLTGVVAISAASGHSCALLTSRQVRCWGDNGSGQLGNGRPQSTGRPVTVLNEAGTGPLTGVAQISADGDTSCARLLDGQVRCWGSNGYGQLGTGTASTYSRRPAAVLAVQGTGRLTDVTQIDVGWHGVCARLRSGRAVCWGANDHGQIGDGTDDHRSRPVFVGNARGTGPLEGVRQVTSGDGHSCVVVADGTGRCWGKNEYGQLGTGSTGAGRPRPAVIVGENGTGRLRGIAHITAAFDHTCARLIDGQVRCWGYDYDGEVGHGTITPTVPVPAVVRNRTNTGPLVLVGQIQTTASHTCVRLQNGEARCWGEGGFGNLGNGDDADSPLPLVVVEPA